jgi:hypothetical protein
LLAQKQIILLGNKTNGEITVLCDLVLLVDEFSAQLLQFSAFQVLDSTVISANDVDRTIHSFQYTFNHLKTMSSDLQLPWYKVSKQEVVLWLGKRDLPPLPVTLGNELLSLLPPLEVNVNDFLSDDVLIDFFELDGPLPTNKKRRK